MSVKFTPVLLALLLAGCAVGPDYQRPTMALPTHFKEAKGWQQATPQDAQSKGDWWLVYHDATLSSLLSQVSISNQNVASYAAQYREAQALTSQSRAALLPRLVMMPAAPAVAVAPAPPDSVA